MVLTNCLYGITLVLTINVPQDVSASIFQFYLLNFCLVLQFQPFANDKIERLLSGL